jgi:FkbM family methyltransferase
MFDAVHGRILLFAFTLFNLVSLPIWQADAAEPAESPLPAIDCPLRRAGIDPTKLKPFDQVEKYIEFLERPDRARWQKPDEVLKALGLKGSETVADLGAGSGYFTFRLSKALPQGRVIAIDNQPEMVRHVHRKARTEDFANVTAQVATTDDPQLPRDADLVFVCDVLMHVRNKTSWLKSIYDQMHRGSRFVLIDFKEGALPEGPPEAIKVPKAEIQRLCREAGFQLHADHADLLPYQQFLVFQRP